jgi:glycosyltransferase involved in cell wall biosynthesis
MDIRQIPDRTNKKLSNLNNNNSFMDNTITIGICIPVLNRGILFKICFDSLIRQLGNIHATICIYDNGSDDETIKIIQDIKCSDHRIIKTFLPQNMGIPYVANLFANLIKENCEFVNYSAPRFTMIMDADAYFKKPIRDLLDLFSQFPIMGLLSGHDSLEHATINQTVIKINDNITLLKEKDNERMLTMIMHRDDFIACYPFPHHRNKDVDWELTQWSLNSVKRRLKKIYVACDYVLHLGFENSTWQSNNAIKNHTQQEIDEVQEILTSLKKFESSRSNN